MSQNQVKAVRSPKKSWVMNVLPPAQACPFQQILIVVAKQDNQEHQRNMCGYLRSRFRALPVLSEHPHLAPSTWRPVPGSAPLRLFHAADHYQKILFMFLNGGVKMCANRIIRFISQLDSSAASHAVSMERKFPAATRPPLQTLCLDLWLWPVPELL